MKNKLIIGFTGTRNGLNKKQDEKLRKIIEMFVEIDAINQFHHGDCVGADSDAHDLFEGKCNIYIHPPVDSSHRAYKNGYHLFEEKTHFARNRAIVDSSDVMIAAPPCKENPGRGGTWYTIDYAKKKNVPLIILFPDGEVGTPGVEHLKIPDSIRNKK